MNALDKRLKVFQVILESITLCRQHETQEQTVFTVDERQDREYLRLGNSTIYSIGHLDSDFHLLQSATGLFSSSIVRCDTVKSVPSLRIRSAVASREASRVPS